MKFLKDVPEVTETPEESEVILILPDGQERRISLTNNLVNDLLAGDPLASRDALGLGDAATLNVGDTINTVAAGNDPRFGGPSDHAYVYIAYASDDTGTDFTTTFDPLLDYIAILPSDVEIIPEVTDFTGLWKNYRGQQGPQGFTGGDGNNPGIQYERNENNDGTEPFEAGFMSLNNDDASLVSSIRLHKFSGSTDVSGFLLSIAAGDHIYTIDPLGKAGVWEVTAVTNNTNDVQYTVTNGIGTVPERPVPGGRTIGVFFALKGDQGEPGVQGDRSYTYIAYASDDTGTGFTTTFNSALDYIGIITSDVELTPVAGDFSGLWKNYKGQQGIQGNEGDGAYVYIGYAADSSGASYSDTPGSGLDYIAVLSTNTEIPTPVASDFAGLWKLYRGPEGPIGGEGTPGEDAFVYIGYASDDSGSDFTLTFNPALDYIAILSTNTEIPSPVVSDFDGLWKNYKGEQGDPGTPGTDGANGSDGVDGDNAYVYIAYASDASGSDFTNTFNPALDYIAVLPTSTEIVTPVASDFTGLWKNYRGATGATGADSVSGIRFERMTNGGNPSDSFPDDGKFSIDDDNMASVTTIKVSHVDADGQAIVGWLSSALIGDKLQFITPTSASVFTISGRSTGAGRYDFTVSTGDGSMLPVGEIHGLQILKKGDKGDQGDPGATGTTGTPGADGADGADGVSAGVVYLFDDSSTSESDPGDGNIRFNHSSMASATEMYVSHEDMNLIDQSSLILTWDESTSSVKGSIYINSPDNSALAAVFDVIGSIVNHGANTYLTIPVTNRMSSGTPSDGDRMSIYFSAKGDVGDSSPVGSVMAFAGNSEPSGYLFCRGQAISRTTYANLYAAVGTTYGVGDGSTTFNIPDIRCRVIAGQDTIGDGLDLLTSSGDGNPGFDAYSIGNTGGVDRYQLDITQMPTHTHSYSDETPGIASTRGAGSASTAINSSPVPRVTGAAGLNEPHPNVQPTIILNYIIKY